MRRSLQCSLLCLLACFCLITACKKDPRSLVGGNMQPKDEELDVFYTDSTAILDIICITSEQDSLLMQEINTALLGSFNDPVFGQTTFNYVFDLVKDLSYYISPEEALSAILDSVILEMAYSSSYRMDNANGKSPVRITVTELGEALSEDSVYFSTQKPILSQNKLLDRFEFTPNPFDSITQENGSAIIRSIKLSLPAEFGNKLLKTPLSEYRDLTSCSPFFKGMYLSFDPAQSPGDGNVFCVHTVLSKGTGIVVYYRIPKADSDTAYERKELYFSVNPEAEYAYIERDRFNADPLLTKQLAGDTALGQEKIFIQSIGGALLRFRLPNIKKLLDEGVIINKACIVMKDVQHNQNQVIEPPSSLIAYLSNADGTISEILDRYTYLDGVYNKSSGEYRIFLTRYIQNLLKEGGTETKDHLVTVLPYNQYNKFNEVILYGPDLKWGNDRMHLEITYTKIPYTKP